MRRSGRTTRLIDVAIQELFTKGWTVPVDHHSSFTCEERTMNKRMSRIMIDRLRNEHHMEEGKHFIAARDKRLGLVKFELKTK